MDIEQTFIIYRKEGIDIRVSNTLGKLNINFLDKGENVFTVNLNRSDGYDLMAAINHIVQHLPNK